MPIWLQIILFIAVIMLALVCARMLAPLLLPMLADAYTGGRGRHRSHGSMRVKDLTVHPRSRSEAEAISHLEQLTGDKFPTVNPPWLVWRGRTLELDGFNGKVALEFSGPLHTKWTPSYESYSTYFERVVRDVVKRRTCAKRGVPFILVDMSLPSRHWRAYIASRLSDFGLLERPIDYVPEQIPTVFRNEEMEKELGLTGEMDAAMRI